jgi:sulfopyruvate decarboxylase subunit beta
VKRFDCLTELSKRIADDALVICNLQDTTYEWNHIRPSDLNLLRVGMANVTPVGIGLALARPNRQVLALDGDGSMLLGPGCLITLARYRPANLTTIIFDNESYNTAGAYPSQTAEDLDLAGVAKASGVTDACQVHEVAEFADAVAKALQDSNPHVIVAKVERSPELVERPTMDGRENKYRFARAMERDEGIKIFLQDEQKSFF